MYNRDADTNAKTRDSLPTREFAVAVTFAGITRHTAARAAAPSVCGRVRKGEGDSGVYFIDTPSGTWAVTPLAAGEDTASRGGTLTSPPMRLPALPTVLTALRDILAAGASFDDACGMAVSVRVPGLTVGQFASLLTLEANGAPLVAEILGDRSRWVTPIQEGTAAALRDLGRTGVGFDAPGVVAALRQLPEDGAVALGYAGGRPEVVTYRALRATLDPVEFAAAVHVALGLVSRAATVKSARPGTGWRRFGDGGKWAAVQFWYIMHGLVGPEFAATRALFRARVRAAHPIDHTAHRPMDTWAPPAPASAPNRSA